MASVRSPGARMSYHGGTFGFMAQQAPSLGRVVKFRLNGEDLAAVIAYVHNDTCVNLMVVGTTGETSGRTSVLLSTGPDDLNGRWRWPEYVAPKAG